MEEEVVKVPTVLAEIPSSLQLPSVEHVGLNRICLKLQLLWSYLPSWIKAIFKAGYLVQIDSTKHSKFQTWLLLLVEQSMWQKHSPRNKYTAADLESINTKGSVLKLKWKVKWVVPLHRKAEPDWSGKVWEKWEIQKIYQKQYMIFILLKKDTLWNIW